MITVNKIRSKLTNTKEELDQLLLDLQEKKENMEGSEEPTDTELEELEMLVATEPVLRRMQEACESAIQTMGGDV